MLQRYPAHCSLWESYAERMDAYLTVHSSNNPVVVVLQLYKLKKYYGAMGASNAFHGTKMIFILCYVFHNTLK